MPGYGFEISANLRPGGGRTTSIAIGPASTSGTVTYFKDEDVLLSASADCYISIGGPANATCLPLFAGSQFRARLYSAGTISVIAMGATAGFLLVTRD
jgi:hypothetical protein